MKTPIIVSTGVSGAAHTAPLNADGLPPNNAKARTYGLLRLLAAACALTATVPLHAADVIWDGGSGDWADANWNTGNTWPGTAGDIAKFGTGGGTVTFTTNTVKELISVTQPVTWTLVNNSNGALTNIKISKRGQGTLKLEGAFDIANHDGGTLIFETAENLGNSQVYTRNGAVFAYYGTDASKELTVNKTFQFEKGGNAQDGVNSSTGATLLVGTDARLTLTGLLRSTGGSRYATKTGAGTLVIGGASANDLDFIASEGTVEFAKTASVKAARTLTVQNTALVKNTGADHQLLNANLNVNGGTLDLNGRNERIRTLNGTGGTVTNNAATTSTLSVGQDGNAASAYAGQLTGNLALTKEGTGKFTLSGTPAYTGLTTLSAGELAFTNAGAVALTGGITGTGTLEKTSGANLTISGVVAPGAVTFDTDGVTPLTVGGGTLTFTGAGGVVLSDVTRLIVGVDATGAITNAIAGAGGLSFANGGELYIVFDDTTLIDIENAAAKFAAAFNLNPSQLENLVIDSNLGHLVFDNTTGLISIPEPSTYALLGAIGAVGLTLLRRRRQRKSVPQPKAV
jgi:autotransporter-associated beta strand protein